MKCHDTRRRIRFHRLQVDGLIAIVVSLLLAANAAAQQELYWDSNGATTGAGTTPTGTWGTSAFWSTDQFGTSATANTTTTALSPLTFSAGTDATGTYTVTVNGTQNAKQLLIEEGAPIFSGGTIALGKGGTIFVPSGAGNAAIMSNLSTAGRQTFNISTGRTLALSTGTFTRGAGSTLNFPGAGNVTSTMPGFSANEGSTGIIGPWATVGTFASTKYARFSGSTITSLTGTAASNAADVTATNGTTNYDLGAGGGTMPATVSANTIRYTGGAGSTTLSSSSFTVNGLMNAGTGQWDLFNTITIGADKELIVHPANNSIGIHGVIQNNGGGASSLTVATTAAGGNSVFLTAANTYTGPTTITSAASLMIGSGASNTGSVSPSSAIINDGTLMLSRQSATMSQGTDFGLISGVGGVITNNGAGFAIVMNESNTYTGGTNVQSGTLKAGVASVANVSGAFGNNSLISMANVAGATLDITGFNTQIRSLAGGGLAGGNVTLGAATLTINPDFNQSYGGVISGNGGGITKIGTAATTFSGANTYTGATTVSAGTLKAGVASVANVSGAFGNNSAISMADVASVALDITGFNTQIGSLTGGGASGGNVTLGAATLTVGGDNTTPAAYAGGISGTGGLTKIGTGTQTLSGASTYTGVTTISGGTLVLDYTASNTGKLSDTAALTLGSGTLQLDRATSASGNHTEVVASTTLSGTASITRGTGSSAVLRMNAITRNTGASVNFGAASIATTDTTNTNGILGPWATVAGADFAMNSTNAADGPITAYTAYTNVTRLSSGTKTIANGSTTNVRIVEGTGSAANVTLGAATTTINTLNHSASGGTSPATVDTSAGTLAVNGILAASGTGALTIGAAAGSGTLTAATAGGELILHNYSASGVTVNSTIANNTSASSFTQNGTGTTELNAANTYTGNTTINGGNLRASNSTGSATGTGAVTVNAHGTLSGTGSISGAVIVNTGGTLAPGASIESLNVGALSLNSGSTFSYQINSNAALSVAADLLNVTGNLTIAASGAALSLSDVGSTYLTRLTLISYSGTWNGNTFDGLANGALVSLGANQYKLTYNDTNAGFNFDSETPSGIRYVTLSAVPEASAVLLGTLLSSVIGLGYFARRLGWRRTPA